MNTIARLRSLLIFAILLCAASAARAQISVGVSIREYLHVRNAQIKVTVRMTNLSGRDLHLADTAAHPWFGFHVTKSDDDAPITPAGGGDYALPPVTLPAGESLERTVDLAAIFPLTEFGMYRVRANIFSEELGRAYTSKTEAVEITDGRKIWEKTVGTPDGLQRIFTLLSHNGPKHVYLYARTRDRDTGAVLKCVRLGPMLDGFAPLAEFDRNNTLHILQSSLPRTFLYTTIRNDGVTLHQDVYTTEKYQPRFVRDQVGGITIKHAVRSDAKPTTPPIKMSDRPVPLPKP